MVSNILSIPMLFMSYPCHFNENQSTRAYQHFVSSYYPIFPKSQLPSPRQQPYFTRHTRALRTTNSLYFLSSRKFDKVSLLGASFREYSLLLPNFFIIAILRKRIFIYSRRRGANAAPKSAKSAFASGARVCEKAETRYVRKRKRRGAASVKAPRKMFPAQARAGPEECFGIVSRVLCDFTASREPHTIAPAQLRLSRANCGRIFLSPRPRIRVGSSAVKIVRLELSLFPAASLHY